jgi:transposase
MCPHAPARSPSWPKQLIELGIEKVTVESSSDYWRIWYYLLEAAGLSVQLVNARDVKNVPGRPKTDKLDAVWLAKLTEKVCCGRPSCPRPRSGGCVTTPGCAWI